MCSIRPTFKGPSVLPKTQRNRAILLRTRLTTLWRSEIHISLKVDADTLKRRWRRFCVRWTIYHIYHTQWRQYADKCACVYGIYSMNNKVEKETNLTNCTSNLTYSPKSFEIHNLLHYRKHNGIAQLLRTRFTTLLSTGTALPLPYQVQWWQCAGKCACVYDLRNVKNKIRNWNKCYRQYFKWI